MAGIRQGYRRRTAGGGRREDLGGLYVRSTWEANWARYLNWLKERGEVAAWEYEPHTFRFPVSQGPQFYTPDFRVRNLDGRIEYHEIKGYLDRLSAVRLARMQWHYPGVRLILIDGATYSRVAVRLCTVIPGWESDRRKGQPL